VDWNIDLVISKLHFYNCRKWNYTSHWFDSSKALGSEITLHSTQLHSLPFQCRTFSKPKNVFRVRFSILDSNVIFHSFERQFNSSTRILLKKHKLSNQKYREALFWKLPNFNMLLITGWLLCWCLPLNRMILKVESFEVKLRLSSSVLKVMAFIITLKTYGTRLSGSGIFISFFSTLFFSSSSQDCSKNISDH